MRTALTHTHIRSLEAEANDASRDELLPAGIAGGNGSGSGSGRESRAAIVVFYIWKSRNHATLSPLT